MKVMQFAFDSGASNPYLPHNFETSNCVCYTGTHDNHTLRGWVKQNTAETNAYAMKYLGVKKTKKLPKAILRAAWASTARIAVAPIQDFLNAPPSDRINTPSTLGGNWIYRTKTADYTEKLKKKIRELNETYGRLYAPEKAEPAKRGRRKKAQQEYNRRYHAAHSEQIRLRKHQYYLKHREKYIEKARQRYLMKHQNA